MTIFVEFVTLKLWPVFSLMKMTLLDVTDTSRAAAGSVA